VKKWNKIIVNSIEKEELKFINKLPISMDGRFLIEIVAHVIGAVVLV
jgi:hypothetical protein